MDKKKSSANASSPDRVTTAGKSNKSKKSKAKEDEEKRIEEELRLKAEKEEKENKEKELLIAQERKLREIKIAEIKRRELSSFYELIKEINKKIEILNIEKRAYSKWERYTRCDGSPDPTISGEIYAFLTLWKEDIENNDFESCIKYTKLARKLIDELDFLNKDLDKSYITEELVIKYKQIIQDLENVLLLKIDQACNTLMLDASENIDPETLNFSFSRGNDELFICIWANLSHNSRIKDFTFSEKNFSFTLPRPLTLAHVAVRCVFTKFDVYSQLSRTYACRVKKEKYTFESVPELDSNAITTDIEVEKDEKSRNENELLNSELTDLSKKEDSTVLPEENNQTEENSEMKEIVEPEILEKSQKDILPDEIAVLQELSDGFVVDLRNYSPIGSIFHFGLFQIPPQPKKTKQWVITQKDLTNELKIFSYPVAEPNLAQMAWIEYWTKKQDKENELATTIDEDSSDHKNKKVDMNLTIKSNDFLESTIGADDTITTDSNKQFLKTFTNKSNESLVKLMKNEGPLQISYKIPNDVYFGEAPLLARWDINKNQWRTDEILDFKYNEEQRELTFKTYSFSAFCLLQDRHVHMPFQLWRIAPREKINNCMLTIETSSFEINIEVLHNQVRVFVPIRKIIEEESNKSGKKQSMNASIKQKKVEAPPPRLDYEPHNQNPNFTKAIEPIANRWFNLHDFKKALKSIGLNIFPEEDSEKFVNITNKSKKLEWVSYQNITLCSNLVSFAYSKWNAEINDENKIVILNQVHSNDKEPNSDLYKCMVCTADLFYITETTEISDEINFSPLQGTQEHADMYHLCLEEYCKENKTLVENRINNIDPLYFETCLELLESIKLLTFS